MSAHIHALGGDGLPFSNKIRKDGKKSHMKFVHFTNPVSQADVLGKKNLLSLRVRVTKLALEYTSSVREKFHTFIQL